MNKIIGMRPHDIIILLKLTTLKDENWLMKDLAIALSISASEVSESFKRSVISGLIASDKKNVNRLALMEFLQYGLPYVFPAIPGGMVRGMPTAHSAPPLKELISAQLSYVWPNAKGKDQGLSIIPLHPKVPDAAQEDEILYQMIALTDAIRVGRQREKSMAINILEKYILKNE